MAISNEDFFNTDRDNENEIDMSHVFSNSHEFRVKYLDQDDIESLGFKKGPIDEKKYPCDWVYFHKGEIELGFYKNPQDVVEIDNGKYFDEGEIYFRGGYQKQIRT
jgi:hypothetical protein